MAQVIIRTAVGSTLRQAALEIRNYLNKHNVDAERIEDMLGDLMSPPIKAETDFAGAVGQKYVRILIPDAWVDNLVAVAPNATHCELVGVCGDGTNGTIPLRFEIDPGVYVGEFA